MVQSGSVGNRETTEVPMKGDGPVRFCGKQRDHSGSDEGRWSSQVLWEAERPIRFRQREMVQSGSV